MWPRLEVDNNELISIETFSPGRIFIDHKPVHWMLVYGTCEELFI